MSGRFAQGHLLGETYAVQADCTGTEIFTVGADPTQRQADLVVADQGRNILLLKADSGTDFTGSVPATPVDSQLLGSCLGEAGEWLAELGARRTAGPPANRR